MALRVDLQASLSYSFAVLERKPGLSCSRQMPYCSAEALAGGCWEKEVRVDQEKMLKRLKWDHVEAGSEVLRNFTGEADPDLPQLDRLAVLVLPSYLPLFGTGLVCCRNSKSLKRWGESRPSLHSQSAHMPCNECSVSTFAAGYLLWGLSFQTNGYKNAKDKGTQGHVTIITT